MISRTISLPHSQSGIEGIRPILFNRGQRDFGLEHQSKGLSAGFRIEKLLVDGSKTRADRQISDNKHRDKRRPLLNSVTLKL